MKRKSKLRSLPVLVLLILCMTAAVVSAKSVSEKGSFPTAPSGEEIQFDMEYLKNNKMVQIDCINEDANHSTQNYWLLPGGFTVSNVQGNEQSGYTVKVTVTPAKYVARYNAQIGVEHVLDPASQGSKTFTFVYDMKRAEWELRDGTIPAVYTVICKEEETEAPTEESTEEPTEEPT
ncbi:MAG: hypothetical protein Q4F21_15045, partial [Lachnospiraceae bacterium]|nr:hypothetical protein [Lachnospiraceae bacterium]